MQKIHWPNSVRSLNTVGETKAFKPCVTECTTISRIWIRRHRRILSVETMIGLAFNV